MHVELQLDQYRENECWSADAGEGVRYKVIPDLQNPYEWTAVWIPTTPDQDYTINNWCQLQAGRRYDYLGILGFVNPKGNVHYDGDLFCSEGCTTAAQQVGYWPDVKSFKTSPYDLFSLAIDHSVNRIFSNHPYDLKVPST